MSKKNNHSTILFVTHKFPPSTGGMQKQSYELIQNISAHRTIHTIIFRDTYPKIFFFLSVTFRTWIKILKYKKIQLIHANDGLMALFLTPLLVYRKRIKFCATIHGLDVVFNSSFYQLWVKKYLSKFDFLIAVSEATQQECIDRGIPKHKVHYIPNAVELPEKVDRDPTFIQWVKDEYNIILSGRFIISSVGRPVPRKGFGWFASQVLPNLKNTTYLVVGTAMESSWVTLTAKRLLPTSLFEKICKMLGVPLDNIRLSELAKSNKNLILMGKIPWAKLLQTYVHSDLFVMPNLHVPGDFEGFGLVALEAGSLGAVCLAANVDGIPSAVKNAENGFLLDSGNVPAWVSKIEELNDPVKLDSMKQKLAGYFRGHQMTWKEMSEEYLKLFDAYQKETAQPS